MRAREKRQFAYSSVHRRVGRWLAAGFPNLSGLRLRRPPVDNMRDDEADTDDWNGGERAEIVYQRNRGKFRDK